MSAQARRFLRRTAELTADEARHLSNGFAVRTPSLPHVWMLNQVRIDGPIAFADAVALADEHLSGIPHRYVAVEHERSAGELEGQFRAAGWEIQREALMALSDAPDREVDTGMVIEPSEEEMLGLMRQWYAEEERDATPEVLDQLVELSRREGRAWNERSFGVYGEEGRLAAITKLRSDGTTAQVEDVYTVPEARGRGFARALVTHAAALSRAAGHELTFIVADGDGWPKELYARIGFRPIATTRAFHRTLTKTERSA